MTTGKGEKSMGYIIYMYMYMYTIVPEAEVNTGEYSLVYKPRRSRGLYN